MDMEYHRLENNYDRMLYLIKVYRKQLDRIRYKIDDHCKEYHKNHTKNSTKSLKCLESFRTADISNLNKLNLIENAIKFRCYNWSVWSEMQSLMLAFLQRAQILFKMNEFIRVYSDLNHISTILSRFHNQNTIIQAMSIEIKRIRLIVSMKLVIVTKLLKSIDVFDQLECWISIFNRTLKKIDRGTLSIEKVESILNGLDIVSLLSILTMVDDFMNKSFRIESSYSNTNDSFKDGKLRMKLIDSGPNGFDGRWYQSRFHIEQNEIILKERPILTALFTNELDRFCSNCLKPIQTFWPCPNCNEIVFCSNKCCEIAIETFHRFECGIYGYLLGHENVYSLVHVFRIYSIFGFELIEQVENRFENEQLGLMSVEEFASQYLNVSVGNLNNRDREIICSAINSLLHHRGQRSSIRENTYSMLSFLIIFCFISRKILDETTILNDSKRLAYLAEQITRIMLRICTNGFCWSRKSEDNPNELTRVASCICLVSSFFNHSCNPNVAWSVDENGITLRALRSIRPGEQLTISYGPKRSNDFDQRQSRLKEDYCFFCQCVACRIDAAIKRFALKCSATENCPGPLLANRYESCLSCGKKTPSKIIDHQKMIVKRSLKKFLHKLRSLNRKIENKKSKNRPFGSFSNRISGKNLKVYLHSLLNQNSIELQGKNQKDGLSDKIVSIEKYFDEYRSVVHQGNLNLFNNCALMCYLYHRIGIESRVFSLIDAIDRSLDAICPEMIDTNYRSLILMLNYLGKFFHRLYLTDNHNQLCRENRSNLFKNVSYEDESKKTFKIRSKLWCLTYRINSLLYEILNQDLHNRGNFFPKLFNESKKFDNRDDLNKKSLKYSEIEIEENKIEIESFKAMKFSAEERFYKTLYENCQRRLTSMCSF